MGDEALAGGRAEEARYEAELEAERRADDPFGDIFGCSWKDPILGKNVDKWLAEDAADIRVQMEREASSGSPSAAVEQMDYAIGDAGADRLGMKLLSMNNSQRDQIIEVTMGHEGGWSEQEARRVRPTKYGISTNFERLSTFWPSPATKPIEYFGF